MASEARTPIGGYVATIVGTFFVSWAVIAFGFGWMSPGTAEGKAQVAVETALKPVVTDFLAARCVAQAQADPDMAAKFGAVQKASSWQQNDKFAATGWATIEGYTLSKGNKGLLVKTCLEMLNAPKEASTSSG